MPTADRAYGSLSLAAGAFFIATVIWTAHCAVHTQAMLARHGEQDWLVDAFVWINRLLTGKPPRQSKATINQPPGS